MTLRLKTGLSLALLCSTIYAAEDKPNVVILATGGTIAGTGATSTTTVGYTAAKIGVDALIAAVPELQKVADVRGEQVFQIASESMNNEHWLKLAKRVNDMLKQKDVDGIVITHGTDTIEETAYFLNLVVKSNKPVVIVGAMRPATAISADGAINLYNAVALAGSKAAIGQGVLVALNDEIQGARDVTKTNTMTTNTFRSPELGNLGYMVSGKPTFYRASTRKHTSNTEFDVSQLEVLPAVNIAYGSANANTLAIDAFAAAGDVGIVYAGTGNGSLATPVRARLSELRKQGIHINRSSRVQNGPTIRNGENNDDQTDFTVADTLSPQKARILLILALTKTKDSKEIQRMFYTY